MWRLLYIDHQVICFVRTGLGQFSILFFFLPSFQVLCVSPSWDLSEGSWVSRYSLQAQHHHKPLLHSIFYLLNFESPKITNSKKKLFIKFKTYIYRTETCFNTLLLLKKWNIKCIKHAFQIFLKLYYASILKNFCPVNFWFDLQLKYMSINLFEYFELSFFHVRQASLVNFLVDSNSNSDGEIVDQWIKNIVGLGEIA